MYMGAQDYLATFQLGTTIQLVDYASPHSEYRR
jgi:hypothetical protein